MVEVTIDSVRVSLMSQHRVVVLREIDGERFLPIWIGPFEADAITIELQGVEVARPLTHDLLKSLINLLGAEVQRVVINDLNNDTFYARIVLDVDGDDIEVNSRPSDAIALAVRCSVPVLVADHVMDKASIMPEEDRPRGIRSAGRQPTRIWTCSATSSRAWTWKAWAEICRW